jgi:GNAT superfamily N-acetyltransferase
MTQQPETWRTLLKPSEVSESTITLGDGEVLSIRPLRHSDSAALGMFLAGLSSSTRRFSTFDGYDLTTAEEMCSAIDIYDKFHLVVVDNEGAIVGLFELGFGLSDRDLANFAGYGLVLDGQYDCMFGPTLADAYQHRGVGTRVFPKIRDVVRQAGRRRIILWGGVLADNYAAIRYYQKLGFVGVGTFTENNQKYRDMLLNVSDSLPTK